MLKPLHLSRFIPALANVIKPFHQLIQKGIEIGWSSEHEQAFEIKKIFTDPQVPSAPLLEKDLLVYLTASYEAIGILIAQEHDD